MFTPAPLSFAVLQSSAPWWTSLAWPVAIIVIGFLVAYSKWGRGITSLETKWVKLERQVADTAEKADKHDQQLTAQQKQIEEQQRALQKLIQDVARYSISDYIFYLLRDLDKAQQNRGEYLYRRDGTMWRNLRFLMDHGYLEEVFPEPAEGANLRDIVKITPAGHALIALRSEKAAGEAA